MRHVAKGGGWTIAEDEILKAAVMKHGLRSWGKIASLLVRKTAQQCKERRTQWLDPSLPTLAWSRQEDETLLRCARSMPAQWQTIAPIVGRSSQQCAERHAALMDLAAGGGGPDASHLHAAPEDPGAGNRRDGGADVHDDDEDLLREARARLGQTLGLRAKRRARKLLMAESQRTAAGLKERELAEAGVRTKRVKRSRTLGGALTFESKSQRIVHTSDVRP